MTNVLQRWNGMSDEEAALAVLPCCGSRAWAGKLAAARPLMDEETLLVASDCAWWSLAESDWDEAFRSHPRIGQQKAVGSATDVSLAWSNGEQASATDLTDAGVAAQLASGNQAYEERFGRIYIVCATGKSAREMLDILRTRMQNDRATETREAAEQQRQITHLRLQKWLRGD